MKIAAGQTRAVTVQFSNANGHPATVQGEIEWASSDDAVATVSGTGAQATITAGPKAGEAEITATADADLGEGVTEVEASLDVEVIAKGEATGGEISPVTAGQGLPGQGGTHPDQGLPGGGGRPDQGLPGHERPTDPSFGQPAPGRPDQGLPGSQPGVDNELPGQPGRPSQGLPGDQPGVDNELPGSPARPDQDLPDHAKPKR